MTARSRMGPSGNPLAVDPVDDLTALLNEQHGVISRRQVQELGGTPGDIERRLRRREWVRLLPGGFVNHTGEPTWVQRAWAGVLYLWPAALAHRSALRAAAGPGWRRHDDSGPIQILVARDRHVAGPAGYSVKRVASFEEKVQWNLAPPRMRLEEALIDVAAAEESEYAAIAVLADACQARRTTAARLARTLRARPRLPRRRWMLNLLKDIADGTCSALEQGYVTKVERSHGLPSAHRQARERTDGGTVYRDACYEAFGLLIELDGRLFHDSARQRDRDLDRDLVAAVDGRTTVRLGWGQVFERPCRTAGRVAALLQQRGWTGPPRTCGPACAIEGATWCR